jgi:predicted transposase YbfD/YdcC
MYPLEEILFLSISALICGLNNWQATVIFGKQKIDWLRKFFPYRNGIPSPDTLERVFSALDPEQFDQCFRDWINEISSLAAGEVVAIDGKTMRGSYDRGSDTKAKHIVSAYAAQSHLCLGQQCVDQKSNEITAIPELLKVLSIQGCLVSIDAIGCQTEIALKIRGKQADYLLAVKENQKDLCEQVDKVFGLATIGSIDTQINVGHGRVESRKCSVINDLTFLDGKEKWYDLNTILRIETERYNKTTAKTSREERYYISSAKFTAQQFNLKVRSHWAVENNLHWMLDVSFGEDDSRRRKQNHAINFNIMAKTALTLLKQNDQKIPISHKKHNAILDDKFREKLMGF